MINPFVVKKYAVLVMCPLVTVMCWFVGLKFYGFLMSLCFLFSGLLLSVLIGFLLLKNPFSLLLEGKGILCFDICSTGIITPFIVGVNSPYIAGKVGGKDVKDVFDRKSVFSLAAPVKNKSKAELGVPIDGEGTRGIKIVLDEVDYNKGRFALFHYPVLLWNSQVNSILTKDFLADGEKEAFAEHSVLYLNRKMEELTSVVRDFGRYVVELTKPKGSIFSNWWVWVIVGVLVVLLVVLFAPSVINAVSGAMNTAGGGVATAKGGAVTIR